jgi:hypothetical protein
LYGRVIEGLDYDDPRPLINIWTYGSCPNGWMKGKKKRWKKRVKKEDESST